MSNFKSLCLVLTLTVSISVVGCSDTSEGGSSSSDGPPCATNKDCNSGMLCLSPLPGAGGACTPTCTAELNTCGASASCSGVGALSVNVCQEEKKAEEQKPEEQAVVPCKTDADCDLIQLGTICATFKGRSECTISCSKESDCDPPSMMGVSLDFLACAEDHAKARLACLPDEKCLKDPMSCISMGAFARQPAGGEEEEGGDDMSTGFGGGFDDFDE